MLNKLRKNNKNGFTLVELIVVLVILAILAALLVPALTGYIDKAKDKKIIAEARQAVMAAQTLADELYAKGNTKTEIETALNGTDNTNLKTLAEVTGTVDSITVDDKGKLTGLRYTNGKSVTYTSGTYSDPS